jgi:hypothetical protein
MYTWSVPADVNDAYSSFRIFMTSKNHGGNDMLVLGGFELYGRLFRMVCHCASLPFPSRQSHHAYPFLSVFFC